jgi:DNA-binding MarR family transcriptional regulator
MRHSSRPRLIDARTGTTGKSLEDLVAVRIARLADVMARLANQAVTAQVGARNVDLRLLNILDAADGLTVNEIARRVHIDKAWVSRSLRRLEKSGHVSRRSSRTDARVCLVYLSSSGRAALDRMKPLTSAREKRLLEGLDETRFKADLDRLMTNARTLLASKDDLNL